MFGFGIGSTKDPTEGHRMELAIANEKWPCIELYQFLHFHDTSIGSGYEITPAYPPIPTGKLMTYIKITPYERRKKRETLSLKIRNSSAVIKI